ncbi:Bax inhibitor-1/YccA family protein [Microbacterium sp. M3]|uniref:Bax inhibitor-1/YccA family protein n=1 Tax=Microbacterium arthrosphaerae TaxID=792652 RepID=A0ABU4H5M5_9MICO|nr:MULTISPECIES: Bax inhibitor-1/YccA family protein [Microbacterium]MDW4573974.1 Bax inhibitor-1/YccA family protein [Microbacterium arthrosphaerae]MDW7607829.1 Bax inhibitor-1/YccA family protein [Microbacterium sp. M3]
MALNNPAFNNPAFQDPKAVQTYPGGPQAANLGGPTQFATAQHAGTDAATQAQLEGMYAAPAAGARETDRMTVEDTVWKTVGLFAILLVTAAVGWVWTLGGLDARQVTQPSILPWMIGALGGFVMAMVVIFGSRKKVRPPLIFAYAAFEGLFVGGISAFFEVMWPGIVVQATLATFTVVGVTLALFASGKVRASKRATKIFLIAMVGYLIFGLINVGLMLFGVTDGAFGLYSEKIMGIPLGLIIGLLVVIMAAYSLVLDFDQVQQGVRNGAPRQFAWLGAFGIMVTVVWLYVEILRIIAIVRGSN